MLKSVACCVLTLIAATALAQPPGRDVPPMPSKLEVGEGFTMFLKGHAIGTQNYVCLPGAAGPAWKQIAPQATLYNENHGEIHHQLMTHFLSANPEEANLARPTWQDSSDSSRVWGRLVQFSNDSAFVEAGAIPWLLLERAGSETGPDGGQTLTRAAYIQRLNTSGGVAPSTGCSQPTDIGAVSLVPYSADYFFYRKRPDAD